MNNEYWLIRKRTRIIQNPITIIDKTTALNIKKAETEFKARNNFKRLLVNSDLVIAKSERWLQ